jgi:uroporphyrinogen decarboxylase
MDSRDRLLIALDGGEPDRVPCALAFYHLDFESLAPPGDWRDEWVDVCFVDFTPSPEESEFQRRAAPHGGDTRLGSPSQESTYSRWRYRPQDPPHANPLARARSLADLEAFPFPELHEPYDLPGLEAQVSAIHARGQAAGGNLPHLGGELFEAAWRLRGLENFLIDLTARPEWADFLIGRLAALACRNAATLVRAGIDVLSLDDDVGMPGTMIISPAIWRRFFKPHFARIIHTARQAKPDLRLLFHSDGTFDPILDDLVEIGFNAINPLQPEHMDASRIRRRYGPRLAFWGTVGRQTTFSFASPADIRHEVEERVATLGRDGLVLCPAYDIDEPDIPWRNVAAFLEAVKDVGYAHRNADA